MTAPTKVFGMDAVCAASLLADKRLKAAIAQETEGTVV
jgi:hypothetical protein